VEKFDRRKRRWFNITVGKKKAGGSKSFLHLKNYYLLSKQRGRPHMDYSIEPINSFANLVEFCIKPTKSSRFYLSIELSSRDKKYRKTRWLKYVVGEGQPEPLINKITNEITEWTIYKEGEPLEDGWTRLKLQLHEDVESTFGREGFVYQSVKRIRLRGSMCLSPITFYKIE